MSETAYETPAAAVTAMVGHVLALAATWTPWDTIDHLAELEARMAGEEPRPDHWHASAITTAADRAPFTAEDLDEARSRLTRPARIWANRLDALTAEQLDHSPGDGWSFREPARHLSGSTYYADAVGDLS